MLMSVNPGFGGQSFIESSLDKIRTLRDMLDDIGSRAGLEVDGGIGPETIAEVARAGANIFVAGSAIFSQADYRVRIAELKKLAGFEI
jgi:ribulose-phosphate 3-epimerase